MSPTTRTSTGSPKVASASRARPSAGAPRWYRLVERPSPAHGPRYVNALSLCQRRPAAPAPLPKRARPAPLLPLSPKLKRARSLASVESFHDLDAAHALAELVSA